MNQVTRYELNRGKIFFVLLIILPISFPILFIGMVFKIFESPDSQLILSSTLGCVLLFFSFLLLLSICYITFRLYYKSVYLINKDCLIINYGFTEKRINIIEINYITENETYRNNEAALNWKGIKINYGSGYTLFISPEKEDALIKHLQEINNKVTVLQKRKS